MVGKRFLEIYQNIINENKLNENINTIDEEVKKIGLAELINDPKRFANIVKNKGYGNSEGLLKILNKLYTDNLKITGEVFDTVFGPYFNPQQEYGEFRDLINMFFENLELLKYFCKDVDFYNYIKNLLLERLVFSRLHFGGGGWLTDEEQQIIKILTDPIFNIKLEEISARLENKKDINLFKRMAFNYFINNDDDILTDIIIKAKNSGESIHDICRREDLHLRDDSPNYNSTYNCFTGLSNDIDKEKLEKLCLKQNYSLFIDKTFNRNPKFNEQQLNDVVLFCQQNCDQEFFVNYIKLILKNSSNLSDQFVETLFKYEYLTEDDKRDMLSAIQHNTNSKVSKELIDKLNDVDEDIAF